LDRYDSIIIGAGHNGLVCAAYLAKAGQRVLVLEAADVAGGLVSTREFHPGFSAGAAHTADHFPAGIAGDLGLAGHGAKPLAGPARIVGLDANGQHVIVEADAVRGVEPADETAWASYAGMMRRFATALDPFWGRTIPRIGSNSLGEIMTFAGLGLKLRRLGKADMHEFMRIASLPARDLMDERFGNDLLKAALSWDGLIGSKMAPRSPNGAVLMMLYRHGREAYQASRLVDALQKAATAAGAEIRTGTAVRRIVVDGDANGLSATGVELADGEQLSARRVISSADPKSTFLDLVGVQNLDIGFTNRIRRLRSDGLVAKLHLALDTAPEFPGIGEPRGRLLIAPKMDTIEFAFDDAKYGNCPEQPVLEVTMPSLDDPALAPPGQHVLSAHVMFVPYRLKGGWNDEARDAIAERAISTIEKYAPGLREHIVGQEFLTPADIETRYGVAGGHWHHGEFAMDQMLMMRPTYDAAQYRTPLAGLWLCGAGCHPAGDLTGLAGHNAAQEMLR
jgi:phytoene dehydrogenase-like protein